MIWASLISRSVMRAGRAPPPGRESRAWLCGCCMDIGVSPHAQSGPLLASFQWEPAGPCGQIGSAISAGESPREHLVEAGPGGAAQAVPPWLFMARTRRAPGATPGTPAAGTPCVRFFVIGPTAFRARLGPPKTMRVLIVDDEPSIRRTTRIAVESSAIPRPRRRTPPRR
jgi:hypothetical protein